VDFVAATTNVPVLEEPEVTICTTLVVTDDSLLENDELLQLLVSAGGLQYRAIITILDTVDSECINPIPLPFCTMYSCTLQSCLLYYTDAYTIIIHAYTLYFYMTNFQ
jgi:hypothetical protein